MSPLGSANGGGGGSESYKPRASRSPGGHSGAQPRTVGTTSPSTLWAGQHYACAEVVARPRRTRRGALGLVRAPRNPAGRGRSGSGGRLPALAAFETSAAAPGSSQEVGGTPTLASFKVRASRLPGRGHIEPSSAQQPSEPHIQLPAVPRIRCPPPKPPSLSHSPSCPPLTATGASSGEAQVGVLRGPGTLGHLGYCVCVERRVPLLIGTTRLVSGSRFLLWFSLGLLSRKERSLEVKASASPPFFFSKSQ